VCEKEKKLLPLKTVKGLFLLCHFVWSVPHDTQVSHRSVVRAWTLVLVLAEVPLLPVTSHWGFYSHTGICIPLPFNALGEQTDRQTDRQADRQAGRQAERERQTDTDKYSPSTC
jgi:hypothetical protein